MRHFLYIPGLLALVAAYKINDRARNDFDYVVIGGGTAGIPVAVRLAEAGFDVAIIEAGQFYEDDSPIRTTTPAFDFLPNNVEDWGFQTTPQIGMNNRAYPYPRGKNLGGTSGRNAMIYQKGPVGAFQAWADAVADESYTLDNLNKFFQKSITFTAPDGSKRASNSTPGYDATALANTYGPLTVTYANWAVPISSWIRRAMAKVGIADAENFDNGKILGAQYFQLAIDPKTQERSSSESTYLRRFHGLPTLYVYSSTLAEKILFDPNNRATGVLISSNGGKPRNLRARREVILSAGAFQSPQLLMVSGIGSKDILSSYNIPVIYESPYVGQNLVDHVWFGITHRVKVETASRWNDDPIYLIQQYEEYQNSHSGPLTSNGGDFGAFEKIPGHLRNNFSTDTLADLSRLPSDWPDVEYVVAPTFLGNFRMPQPRDGYQYASLAAALMAPMSRGNISIASSSARDAPVINPNALTHPADREVAVAAFTRMREIWGHAVMDDVKDGEEYYPGERVRTKQDILAHLEDSAMVYYHAGGTCKMGTREKESAAVVDSRARVIGVDGLRIVDASVLPFLIPSHIQSAIYALAEKIAEDITQEAERDRMLQGLSQEL